MSSLIRISLLPTHTPVTQITPSKRAHIFKEFLGIISDIAKEPKLPS